MSAVNLKSRADRSPVFLPAALIATAWAGMQTWFFTSLEGGTEAFFGALIPTLLYTFYFFMILRSRKPAVWRRAFFVTIALVFFPAFIANLLDARGTMSLGQETIAENDAPFCHIAFTMTLVPQILQAGFIYPARMTQGYASVFSMLLIWALASLTLGRGWCSWVCFYGGWDDGFSRLAKKARVNLDKAPETLRWFSFAMLGFVVLASMASLVAVYCEWLCPFKLVTEYAAISGFTSFIATVLFMAGFVGLVVVMPLLSRKRFQCASFCPFGALQSLIDRISPFRMKIDTNACVSCMACVSACPTLSLSHEGIREKTGLTQMTCTKCGDCVDACPKSAIRLDFRRGGKAGEAVVDQAKQADAAGKTCSVGTCPQEAVYPGTSPGAAALDDKPGEADRSRPVMALVGTLVLRTLKEFTRPRLLFVTAAFTLGMIVSSGFAQGTFTRLINWVLHGAFTLASKGGLS